MEIYIDTDKTNSLQLTPSMYCYLYALYYKDSYVSTVPNTLKKNYELVLQELGYLKITEEGIVLRTQTKSLFDQGTPTKDSVSDWIEDWRELFPKGVKSGNRPVRGDKQGVKKKMTQFVKQNPDVTKDEIFDATRQYVYESSLKNYNYIICADYFINKNGSSTLGATIEDIDGKGSTLKKMEEGGSSPWHKEI